MIKIDIHIGENIIHCSQAMYLSAFESYVKIEQYWYIVEQLLDQ